MIKLLISTKKIKKLISEDRMEEAFASTLSIVENERAELYNSIILLLSQYRKNINDRNLGINDDIADLNRIKKALLEIIAKIEKEFNIVFLYKNLLFLAFSIGIGALLVYGVVFFKVKESTTGLIKYQKLFAENDEIVELQNDRNDKLLTEKFQTVSKSLKILTIDGGTWLLSGNYTKTLMDKANSIDNFEILLFDNFTENGAFHDTRIIQQGFRPPQDSIMYIENYSRYLTWRNNKVPEKNGFNLFLYDKYPWVRFTIFDDTAVSFILLPTLREGGKESPKFYSEDKKVVDCFIKIFNEFKQDAHPFSNKEELLKYITSKNL